MALVECFTRLFSNEGSGRNRKKINKECLNITSFISLSVLCVIVFSVLDSKLQTSDFRLYDYARR